MRAPKAKKKQIAKKERARRNQKMRSQVEDAVQRVVEEYGDVLQRLGKE